MQIFMHMGVLRRKQRGIQSQGIKIERRLNLNILHKLGISTKFKVVDCCDHIIKPKAAKRLPLLQ